MPPQVDSTTGAPVTEGPRVLKWEKALRAMCARMGAKFVAYKADGGVWRFEVGRQSYSAQGNVATLCS